MRRLRNWTTALVLIGFATLATGCDRTTGALLVGGAIIATALVLDDYDDHRGHHNYHNDYHRSSHYDYSYSHGGGHYDSGYGGGYDYLRLNNKSFFRPPFATGLRDSAVRATMRTTPLMAGCLVLVFLAHYGCRQPRSRRRGPPRRRRLAYAQPRCTPHRTLGGQWPRAVGDVWTYTANDGVVINIEAAVDDAGVFFGTWGVMRAPGKGPHAMG